MDTLRPDPTTSRSPSLCASPPIPALTPSNDDIEAVIQMATSSRSSPDGRPPKDTRTQLFVGNLPYRVRWQDLKDLFRKAGTVLRADVSLGPDNRSRGYGTVLLATAEDAGRAIDMFNGYSWQTRILEVRIDRLPPDLENPLGAGPSPGIPAVSGLLPFASSLNSLGGMAGEIDYTSLLGLDRPSSSSGAGGRNLFVGNLPFHCQWQDLKDLFRQAGTIIRADVALGQDGRSRGFGTVVFATEYDADRAVKMFNGYEYNGRALKVHYDKFSQSTQPVTMPSSPNVASFSTSNVNSPFQYGAQAARPNHIVIPSGYTLDFGPASGPTTPYEYPPLQMSMPHPHHLHSHIHQPQPTLQKPEVLKRPSLLKDVDLLSSTLNSTHLNHSAVPSKAPSSSSSSSESVRRSTSSGQESSSSVSSISPTSESGPSDKSPSVLNAQAQLQTQPPAHSPRPANHPHHPGPINIPPPPPITSFTMPMPMHNMSPMGLPMSPHYYPGLSPLHHPAHGVAMTPHGLPPITPSMPPFTFLPPMPLASPGYEPTLGDLNFSLHLGLNGTVMPHHTNQEGTPTSQFPQPVTESNDGSSSKSPRPSTPMSTLRADSSDSSLETSTEGGSPTKAKSNTKKSNADPSNINPYFQTRPRTHYPEHPHPHPHPAHTHLAQLTPFSPGVAMSPGTFWGRPGVAGPNPYLNLAVGAPVHAGQMSPGGFFFHPHHPHSPGIPTPGAMPGSVGAEMGSRGGGEPGGYFDSAASQGYFPPIGVAPVMGPGYGAWGVAGVEGEILKDKKDKDEDREKEIEEARQKGAENPWGSGTQSQSQPQMLESPDWEATTSGSSAGEVETESKKGFPFGNQDQQGCVSRTHSMSASMMKRPVMHRPDSDPIMAGVGEQAKTATGSGNGNGSEGRPHNERSGSLQP